MLVGNREETVDERVQRHKKEAEQQIESWQSELEFAKSKDDAEYRKYEKHCDFMIETWKNTIAELEKQFPLEKCIK